MRTEITGRCRASPETEGRTRANREEIDLKELPKVGRHLPRASATAGLVGGLLLLPAGSLFTRAESGRVASLPREGARTALLSAASLAAIPNALDLLVKQAATAANTRKPAALTPMAAGDAAQRFGWTRSQTSTWQGDVLETPLAAEAGTPAYLAVFHAWHSCESDGDHVHALMRTPEGWKLGAEVPETETGGFRVRDHDLHVTFDFPKQTAAITDRVQIERTRNDVPGYALIRLSQDFRVRQFTREGPGGAPVPFRQVGGVIAFVPPAEKTFTLWMQYAGSVNHQGSDYILANEATLDSYWYPNIARLPATATVTATVPSGWMAIGQGETVKQQRGNDGALTITFRNDIPTCFFTLDAGRYTITSRQVDGRTLSAYLLTANPTLANRCLDVLARALAFYDSHFGHFPYTRYTIVQTQGAFEGALEAYSFATFGPGTLPFVIPHELAHTWWGGVVPCTYTRSMWDESFAEYSDGLFQRLSQKAGSAPGRRRLEQHQEALLRGPIIALWNEVAMSDASDTSNGAHNAVGYGKGPRVLRVLEEQIGLEAMLRSLAAFYAGHPRGTAAEWPAFEQVVNKITGQDLHWFFAEWVERPGLPVVRLTNVSLHNSAADTFVEGDIVQEGTPYRLRMPLLCEERGGVSDTETVDVDGPRTHFSLHATATPVRLTLDPDGALPLAAPPDADADTDVTSYAFPQVVRLPNLPAATALRFPTRSNDNALFSLGKGVTRLCISHPAGGFALPYCQRSEAQRFASSTLRSSRGERERFRRNLPSPRIGGGEGGAGLKQEVRAREAFLRRAAAVVNRGDRDAFKALIDPSVDADTDWVGAKSELPASDPANAQPWHVLPLALPEQGTASSAVLAVFTKYHPAESSGDHVFALEQQEGRWRLGHEYAEADPIGLRLHSHRARVTLDPHTGTLRVSDHVTTISDRATVPLPVPGIFLLRLEYGYPVDSIRSKGHPVWFRQAGGVLAVKLPEGQADFDIAYHGTAVQNGEDFILPSEAALSGYWLPHIGRLPVTYDVALTVPRGWAAFTQGILAGKTVAPERRSVTFAYHNTLPVCYPSLAAGPYRILSMSPQGGAPYGVSVAYLHDSDKEPARRAWQTAVSALRFYSTHFSPFPYPRYTVVVSDRYAMALEGYSMVTIARGYIPNVLPHEIAHTWWGGVVPNTYLRDLWNESFAEYADGLYERMTGHNDGMHLAEVEGIRMAGLLANDTVPLNKAHDALEMQQSLTGYFKGSMVLETLEPMLGQKRMLDCIRAFVAQHKPYTAATWDDFVDAVTATAGPEWRGFFAAWLPSAGVPELRLENVQTHTNGTTQEIDAEVAQSGDTVYWMDVPVDLQLKGGNHREVTVTLEAARAPVHFTIPIAAKPETLEIDSHKTLLRTQGAADPAPTLSEMLARGEPMRVVYGTGGSAQEQAAMRASAKAAADLFSFAKVTVLSDKAAMDRQGAGSGDLLLIGRPETNAILTLMAGTLPVRFAPGPPPAVTLDARTFADPGIWTFAITSLPFSEGQKRYLLVFGGLSAASMGELAHVRSLPGTQSVYVATGEGQTLASRGGVVSAPTTYRFPASPQGTR